MKFTIRNQSFFLYYFSYIRDTSNGEVVSLENNKKAFEEYLGKITLKRNTTLNLLFIEDEEFFFTIETKEADWKEVCSIKKTALINAINKGKIEILDFAI
ncbi:hypothetical protein [Listeria sp. PSOL-1]|uniref:hypothetical protein n=1 Tax=Listeria sp. PSOL-1 TaxID=1844999 RepID=UPI0013D086C7|nr:hypothetical protein [Listeria sp. PSOL-1]